MRLLLLVPVLICVAAPAYAEGVRESRYGPTTPRQANVVAAARYDGPMLGWSNKRQPQPPIVTSPAATPPTFAPPATPVAYAPPPVQTAPALPTSLYATPRPQQPVPTPAAAPAPAVAAPVVAKDWSNYRSTRMTGVAPAPQQVASANTGATRARYYSVDREYGLTPDAVPPTGPDNRVLITASEPPPEPRDATPMHGSADWLAAGVAGDDDQADDSASRRAKTRNEAL
jgi:hypothetical protein